MKALQPGIVVSDRGGDVVNKGGIGTVSNGGCGVCVASSLIKGEASLAEIKAIFGIELKTDE